MTKDLPYSNIPNSYIWDGKKLTCRLDGKEYVPGGVSMTLLDRITALSKDPWPIDRVNVPLEEILEVLQAFQPGDGDLLAEMAQNCEDGDWPNMREIEILERYSRAAKRMEQP